MLSNVQFGAIFTTQNPRIAAEFRQKYGRFTRETRPSDCTGQGLRWFFYSGEDRALAQNDKIKKVINTKNGQKNNILRSRINGIEEALKKHLGRAINLDQPGIMDFLCLCYRIRH